MFLGSVFRVCTMQVQVRNLDGGTGILPLQPLGTRASCPRPCVSRTGSRRCAAIPRARHRISYSSSATDRVLSLTQTPQALGQVGHDDAQEDHPEAEQKEGKDTE